MNSGPVTGKQQTQIEAADLLTEALPEAGRSGLVRRVGAGDHYVGDPRAAVELIEYGDYECPFCGLAQPAVSALLDRHGAELVFAFRHFPLVSQHPHAWMAALAAEAAARQNRFWEMHTHLLSHQHTLTRDDLFGHARGLGLDVGAFERDLADPDVAEHVRLDALGGLHSGVQGTPTFFVNGGRLEGGFREPELEAAVRAAVAR